MRKLILRAQLNTNWIFPFDIFWFPFDFLLNLLILTCISQDHLNPRALVKNQYMHHWNQYSNLSTFSCTPQQPSNWYWLTTLEVTLIHSNLFLQTWNHLKILRRASSLFELHIAAVYLFVDCLSEIITLEEKNSIFL